MTSPENRNPAPDTPLVLNGWKEIAAHFRKGVRTVQRWESEMDLPVHRLAGQKGEVVYAVPSELEEWRRLQERRAAEEAEAASGLHRAASETDRTTSGTRWAAGRDERAKEASSPRPDPVHSRAARPAWIVAAALGTAALAAVAWAIWPRTPREPAAVHLDRDRLVAVDSAGVTVWTAALPYAPVNPQQYETQQAGSPHHRTLVDDLDGDGRREVVIAIADDRLSRAAVICYGPNGRQRWIRRPERSARFGHGRMAAPWIPLYVATFPAGDSSSSLWVSWANRPDFGAFAERLDVATGQPRAVFWSGGYVTEIATGNLGGRQVLLVGANNNEHRAASLAVYDLKLAAASAPAANTHYACLDCPAGRPLAFFVFPKTSVGQELLPGGTTAVTVAMVDAQGQLKVAVEQGPGLPGLEASVLYRFDAALRLTGAATLADHLATRRRLEREGRLPAGAPPSDERELFPVLSWDGAKFVEIRGPEK